MIAITLEVNYRDGSHTSLLNLIDEEHPSLRAERLRRFNSRQTGMQRTVFGLTPWDKTHRGQAQVDGWEKATLWDIFYLLPTDAQSSFRHGAEFVSDSDRSDWKTALSGRLPAYITTTHTVRSASSPGWSPALIYKQADSKWNMVWMRPDELTQAQNHKSFGNPPEFVAFWIYARKQDAIPLEAEREIREHR